MVDTVVVGLGEIGGALYEILKERYTCKGIDIKGDYSRPKGCKHLNICIPWSEAFVEIVNDYVNQLNPQITIIHSSVPVGTTKKISGLVVHSPVRGKHPKIKEAMLSYIKYVGYNEPEAKELIEEYYGKIFRVKYVQDSNITEFMKLASLAKYTAYLAIADEIETLASEHEIDYEYTKEWDRTQNEKIGEQYRDMQMPVLSPPKGVIGGHCCLPITEILLGGSKYVPPLISEAYKRYS